MNNTILLIISLVIVGIIFLFGFVSAKNMKRKYSQLPNETQEQSEASVEKPAQMRQTDIYEKSGKNQESDHPLGAIQSVIRGRIRFIPTGLSFIAIALFGLYIFYFTDKKFLIDRTPINTVIVTILFIGAILCGLQFVNYAFYRIKLRHTGFEISSMLGTKSYE
ncbi:hypothetical protein, partial [Fusobacterium sp. PH5-44]|uniref:hypothetical protein n=1 Tax=unclassified Fusobacterium TaxID=2648384 RepID=UPI003D1E530A